MATLTQMRSRARAVLRDSESSFISDTQLTEWINEAYLDLCARLRLIRTQTTGTTDSDGTISLPSGFMELVWLSVQLDSVSTDQQVVSFVDDSVFDSWRLDSNQGYPEAQLGRIFGADIETYPVIESLAYTLRYVQRPTALSADGDTPAIPEELHVRLINYARAHAKLQEGELDEADRYMGLYSEGLPSAPLTSNRERPGPFDLVMQPNWYDAEV